MKFTIIISGLSVLISAFTVDADMFLRYKKATDAYKVAGSEVPATTGESKAWISKEMAAFDDGEGHRSIMHFTKRTLTVIDIGNKQYSVINIDSVGSMINSAIAQGMGNDEDAEAMNAMMQGMMGDMLKSAMTVKKSAERQKIGAWNCTRYDITLSNMAGKTVSEMWITKEIKCDPAYFNMLKNGMLALMPGFGSIAEEMKKIDGIPVKTVTKAAAMNVSITSTETLLESAEKAAPAGTYSIPKGFELQSYDEE